MLFPGCSDLQATLKADSWNHPGRCWNALPQVGGYAPPRDLCNSRPCDPVIRQRLPLWSYLGIYWLHQHCANVLLAPVPPCPVPRRLPLQAPLSSAFWMGQSEPLAGEQEAGEYSSIGIYPVAPDHCDLGTMVPQDNCSTLGHCSVPCEFSESCSCL
jgi:hypothetical protein